MISVAAELRSLRGLALVAMLSAPASLAAPANLVDNGADVPTILEAKPPPQFAASTTATAHRILLPSTPALHVRLSVFEGKIEILTPAGTPLRARLELNDTPCRPVNPLGDEPAGPEERASETGGGRDRNGPHTNRRKPTVGTVHLLLTFG